MYILLVLLSLLLLIIINYHYYYLLLIIIIIYYYYYDMDDLGVPHLGNLLISFWSRWNILAPPNSRWANAQCER